MGAALWKSVSGRHLRSSEREERCTKHNDIGRLFVEPQIVLAELCKSIVDCCLIGQEVSIIPLGFPGSLQLLNCRKSAP